MATQKRFDRPSELTELELRVLRAWAEKLGVTFWSSASLPQEISLLRDRYVANRKFRKARELYINGTLPTPGFKSINSWAQALQWNVRLRVFIGAAVTGIALSIVLAVIPLFTR